MFLEFCEPHFSLQDYVLNYNHPNYKLFMKLICTTLTEVFPCFFLSCKANSRVKVAKTGHGSHSSKLVVTVLFCCYLYCSVVIVMFCHYLCCSVVIVLFCRYLCCSVVICAVLLLFVLFCCYCVVQLLFVLFCSYCWSVIICAVLLLLHCTVVICVVLLLFMLFYVLFVCKCILILLPPGGYPIAVNKYISIIKKNSVIIIKMNAQYTR